MQANFYPYRVASVELRQTHISYVLLAGDYVYKVKKPVRFTFLDYSSLEKRRHFCHEEIRLKRSHFRGKAVQHRFDVHLHARPFHVHHEGKLRRTR